MLSRGPWSLLFTGLLCFVLLMSACTPLSSGDPKSEGKKGEQAKREEQREEKIPEAPTDIEGIMMQNPGKFSGENYDQAEVEKALDQLPDNLNTDEAYNQLCYYYNPKSYSTKIKLDNLQFPVVCQSMWS